MSALNLLSVLVLNDLKEMGIKHKEKKNKTIKSSLGSRLFCQDLHNLKLTDAFLSDGTLVQVPQFVAEACSYILEHCETEGLFRKAGSVAKQREIRKCLEDGQPLGKSHRAIDIANILSYFFRELPEPLIPSYLHDTLVRCLLTVEPIRIRCIQLTCLLTPQLNVNTLAYFLQFLNTITRQSKYNKMCAENLAIVIAPSVMPYRDINSIRFKNHIKIVELLIQNANIIGTVPPNIREKLLHSQAQVSSSAIQTRSVSNINVQGQGSAITSKNRRSYIFSAIKTKIGLSNISSERIDSFGNESHIILKTPQNQNKILPQHLNYRSKTSVKTRKFAEPINTFCAKKSDCKNLANHLCGPRETKKIIDTNNQRVPASTRERRWSLVSNGWAKYKKKEQILHNRSISTSNILNDVGNCEYPPNKIVFDKAEEANANQPAQFEKKCLSASNSYDALADRVESLETHIPETNRQESLETHIPNMKTSPSLRKISTIPKKRRSFNTDVLPLIEKKQVLHDSQENDNNIEKNTRSPEVKAKQQESVNCLPEIKTPISFGYMNDEIPSHHQWVSAKKYFENIPTPMHRRRDQQCSHKSQNIDALKTTKPLSNTSLMKLVGSHRKIIVDLDDDQCRASISRLRIENAGMVLAKAKLFEDFNCS